ncbi:MAG: metallophosphoesterase [Planctomycetia bacterium]|nr:metallophosphoesterase [Planctomycetia bacterium]
MQLPMHVEYPVIAIGDLHGRVEWLDALVAKLRQRPEWPEAKFVFLGDLVDRTDTVKELVSRVLELIAEKPGSTCVMGNHDLALVKAAGLHDQPPPEYWVRRYGDVYDHKWTFQSYLGRTPDYLPLGRWVKELADLKAAVPAEHRAFLASLPWVAEAEGHIFLHNGLSPELDCPARVQLECLKRKVWDRAIVNPRFGTDTDRLFTPEYPVWLGADRKLSEKPLPFPGKVQVSGHIKIDAPEVNPVGIRIDTSGGICEPLTGCILTSATAEPVFVFSKDL